MRKIILALALVTSPALAQPRPAVRAAPPAANGGRCAVLARDYRGVEYALAQSNADGIADNSAPRATMRAIRDSNELMRAQMTLDLMRAHNCPMPDRAPNEATYMLGAMECATARLRQSGSSAIPACDVNTWVPLGSSPPAPPQQ